MNVIANGRAGLNASLLGAGLGLLVLLPFVFLRSLGAGDWKLAGALGAFVGWQVLVDLLMGSVFVAGIMALGLVIYKRTIQGNAAQHCAASGVDVDASDAGSRGFAG